MKTFNKTYFTSSLKSEQFRTKIHRIFALFGLVLAVSSVVMVSSASFNKENRYKLLHTNFERELNDAFDKYEELLIFMEKQASEKGEYREAIKFEEARKNRATWKVDFGDFQKPL